MLFYFIFGGVNFVMYPKYQPPGEIFSQIWIQEKYESKFFLNILFFFTTLIEPCIEIWQIFLLWLLKISKSTLIFSTFSF